MRQMCPLLLYVLIAACSGNRTAGKNQDRIGYDGETASEACSVAAWTDGAVRLSTCSRLVHPTVEPWSCDCDNADLDEVYAEGECKDELVANCGVDEADFASCHVDEFGTCVSGDGDGKWACACIGETELTPTSAFTCESALWAHCGEECTGAFGSCVLGTQLQEYACTCSYYGDAVRTVWDQSCPDALDAVCRPGSRPCTGYQGYCDENPGTGYECGCIDGTSGSRSYDELGGDVCRDALEEVCGTDAPAGTVCERQLDTATRGECVLDFRTNAFHCQCTTSTDGSGSVEGREVTADSCEEALEQACGTL